MLAHVADSSFPSGLWLVLIGLVLRQAAAASESQATLASTLGDLPVAEVMTRDVVTVSWNATVADLVEQFWDYHFTSFPVVAGGVVRGIATVHDVGRVPMEAWARTSVQNVIRPLTGSMTIAPTESALNALRQTSANGLGRLAVLDGTRLVGYLSFRDLGHVLALRGLPQVEPIVAPSRPEFGARRDHGSERVGVGARPRPTEDRGRTACTG